jgi:hypothetical protein
MSDANEPKGKRSKAAQRKNRRRQAKERLANKGKPKPAVKAPSEPVGESTIDAAEKNQMNGYAKKAKDLEKKKRQQEEEEEEEEEEAAKEQGSKRTLEDVPGADKAAKKKKKKKQKA